MMFMMKKPATKKAHPLQGVLEKRMRLFDDMAAHSSTQRPPRKTEDVYVRAEDV